MIRRELAIICVGQDSPFCNLEMSAHKYMVDHILPYAVGTKAAEAPIGLVDQLGQSMAVLQNTGGCHVHVPFTFPVSIEVAHENHWLIPSNRFDFLQDQLAAFDARYHTLVVIMGIENKQVFS